MSYIPFLSKYKTTSMIIRNISLLLIARPLLHVLLCVLMLFSIASGSAVNTSHHLATLPSSFKIALGKIPGYAIVKFDDSDVAYLCEIKFDSSTEKHLYSIEPQPAIFRPLTRFSFSHRVEDIQSLFVCALGKVKRIQHTNIFDYENYSIHITMSAGKYSDKTSFPFNVIVPKEEIDDSSFFSKIFDADSGEHWICTLRYSAFGRRDFPGCHEPSLQTSPPLLISRNPVAGNYIMKLDYLPWSFRSHPVTGELIIKQGNEIKQGITYNYHKITDLNYCYFSSSSCKLIRSHWFNDEQPIIMQPIIINDFVRCILGKYKY